MANRSFDEFRDDLIESLLSARTDDEKVHAVAGWLTPIIRQPDFLHACIERICLTMSSGRAAWRNPPFDESIDAGYLSRWIFWPARFCGDVHRHNCWTVSGVVHGQLSVVIYDDNGRQELRRYAGGPGAIGKVVPPCVHATENNINVPAVSMAVFCRKRIGERQGPEVDWLTETQEAKYAVGGFERALRAFVFIINENPCDRSMHLLDTVFNLARPSLKMLVIKAISRIDPRRAQLRLEDLRHYVDDPVTKTQIEQISAELGGALSPQ